MITEFPIEIFMLGQGSFTSLFGQQLNKMKFNKIREAKDFISEYEDLGIYGQTSMAHQFLAWKYPGQIEFDVSKFCVLNFDIETRFDGYDAHDHVRVRRTFSNIDEEVTVEEMKKLGSGWEVWDKYNERWYNCGADNPLLRPGGFPSPEKADYEITSISCKVFGDADKVTFGLKDYVIKDKDQVYIKCKDETQLLMRFIKYVNMVRPDIMTGWNIEFFDIPYIVNRIIKLLGEENARRLSPFYEDAGKQALKEEVVHDRKESTYKILGISIFDYMQFFQMFNPKKLDSYALNYVGQVELKEEKLDYSEYGDLMDLYEKDFQKYIDYNEKDVYLVERLDDKKQFIRLAITTVMMTKSRFQEVTGKIRLWDNLIYNMLLDDNLVIPPPPPRSKNKEILGAYVKSTIPGKYRWVLAFDLTSLYPSICMMFNMSPETLKVGEKGTLDYVARMLKGEDLAADARMMGYCMAVNGSQYTQIKTGILPRAMKFVFDTRKAEKKKMNAFKKEKEQYLRDGGKDPRIIADFEAKIAAADATQGAMKILANSGYGATASPSFRYYSKDIAQGITVTGQFVIQFIADETNKFLNKRFGTSKDYVIASDTDSMYLCLDNFPSEPTNTEKSVDELDRFAEDVLTPFINERFDALSQALGCKTNMLDMKRESISDVGIWRAKKNYVLQVYDNEGVRYAEPELKMMGIETARGNTPKIVKDEIQECLNIMLRGTNEELMARIAAFEKKFKAMPLSDMAKPLGVSNMDDFKPGDRVPYNTKAAMVYNDLVVSKGLQKQYSRIKGGTKVKLLLLKDPNPTRNNHIAFLDDLPPEFGLHKYVDVQGQYTSVFLNPIKSFTDAIGWLTEKRSDLSELFG